MRVSSWNIMHGINLQRPTTNGFPSIDPAELNEACAEITTDVLAVQELDQYQNRSGNLDQAALISAKTGLASYRFAPTVLGNPDQGKKGWQPAAGSDFDQENESCQPRYGIGLFTNYPVKNWYRLDLVGARITTPIAIPGENGKPRLIWINDEPRVVLAAELETQLGPIIAATTHLSFVPIRNLRQLRITLNWLAQFPQPKVLLGDLNLPARVIKYATSLRRTPTTPTFPIGNPKAQFDHILTTRDREISEVSTKQMLVGDHLMISATIN
ncbi:MAG: endonuclease [Actinobacteria bacterium]|jgi:endonuclease/exonuclease/phosphatase family metal-dependent hydrolase|nr:endonuclease [Actinomycetota bacterium]